MGSKPKKGPKKPRAAPPYQQALANGLVRARAAYSKVRLAVGQSRQMARSAFEWLGAPSRSLTLREIAAVGAVCALFALLAWLPVTGAKAVRQGSDRHGVTEGIFIGYNGDLSTVQYPSRIFLRRSLEQGTLPLWNPYHFNGLPTQTGFEPVLNLSGLLSQCIAEVGRQVEADIVLHCWIAMWGMALFFGTYGYRRIACFAGASGWALGGSAVSHVAAGHLDLTAALAWFPWVLLAYHHSLHRPGAGYLGLTALLVSVQLSYGSWQGLYLTAWAALTLKTVSMLLGSARAVPAIDWGNPWREAPLEGGQGSTLRTYADGRSDTCLQVPMRHRLLDLRRGAARTVIVALMAGLLSAFYSWPSLETAQWAHMGERALRLQFNDNPGILAWQSLLSPGLLEYVSQSGTWSAWTPWDGNLYLGVVPLAFLLSFVFLKRKLEWLPQIFVIVLTLALGLGDLDGIFGWYRQVDPLACFVTPPARYWLITEFCLLWLAVRTCSEYFCQSPSNGKLLRIPKILLTTLGLFWVAMYYDTGDNLAFLAFVHAACDPGMWHRFLQGTAPDGLNVLYVTIWMKLGFTLFVLACVLYALSKFPRPVAAALLLLLMLLDSLFTVNHFATMVPKDMPQLPPTWEHFLRIQHMWEENTPVQKPFAQRICPDPRTGQTNRFAQYGLAEVSGKATFAAPAFEEACEVAYHFVGQPPLPDFVPFDVNVFLNMLGARYYLSSRDPETLQKENKDIASMREVGAWKSGKDLFQVRVYDNLRAAPRAWVRERPTVVAGDNQLHLVARALGSKEGRPCVLDAATYASVAAQLPPVTDQPSPIEPSTDVESVQPNAVVVDAGSPRGGILVLSDLYWPGWLATVDGLSCPVLSVNGGLCRGVVLPAGDHRVVFRYFPKTLLAGLCVSALTLCVFLTYGLYGFLRERFLA